jgi:hypothetical protein
MKVLFFDKMCPLLCSRIEYSTSGFSGHIVNGGWHLRYDNGTAYACNDEFQESVVTTIPDCSLMFEIEVPPPICDLKTEEGWIDYNRIIQWARIQQTIPDFVI